MRVVFKIVIACLGILLSCYGANCQMNLTDNATTIYSTDDSALSAKDTTRLFVIHEIYISGNSKTKPAIILRELSFNVDEEYPLNVIADKFRKARRQLMNTGLFHDVTVSMKSVTGHDVDVNISVKEKWYVWPKVFLRPVDKSFGEWWNEKGGNLDRINYGVRLSHNNFTGRNDKLKVSFMNGYTRQVSLQYYGLWLDKDLKWSTNAGISFGENREVNYMTLNNRQVPLSDGNKFLRTYVGGFLQLTYRPAIKTYHTFGISYAYDDVADTIFKLNPHYYSRTGVIQYPEFLYKLSYFDVDYIPYPTKGFMGEISLQKKGLNTPFNLWQITAKASRSWALNDNYFVNLKGVGMVKLPFSQPYTAKQFIGFDGNFLQGYEYYVIDGVAGAYTKASLSRSVFKTRLNFSSKKFKCLNDIPIRLYAKTFVNAGYVYNTIAGENQLTNRMLYSGGVGLDLVTCNDFIIKIEWSFNRLGQNGLYLHQRNDF